MKKNETTRIQMELSTKAFERLKNLKDLSDASSYAEVTKNSYKLYQQIMEIQNNGGVIFLRNEDGTKEKLKFPCL